ncbi:helix-turn-helix domain-containing protein, partial [Solibacillus silvestris]|uniref:helix-turn-helix domain-containing protein n=1 Tax=Solibacillus silvestris TaxID=76853 RepID=UPI003F7E03E9
MENFGEKMTYFRKSKGLSIKKLAENLCDESTIFRLEKGKQLPRLEILNDICMKLEIPLQALFPFNEEVEVDLRQIFGHILPKFFLGATSRTDCS